MWECHRCESLWFTAEHPPGYKPRFCVGAKEMYFVSATCKGEKCWCGSPAEHKVEESIAPDDPMPNRHPLTRYICHVHFHQLMGPAADRMGREKGES
jgi:hypothetical protein